MKVTKRSKEQREADMNTLARLYVKGTSQIEIGRQLGVSQGQVSNDLKRLLKRWEETRLNEIDRYKHEQLLRINMIEEEMWSAWEKSKISGKKTVSKGKSGEFESGKDPLTGKTVTKDDYEKYWRVGEQEELPEGKGDMQYMNGIMWCTQERAKIVGLYAPKKVAATDPTGEFEATTSARDELMGLMSGIVKRMNPETPEEQNFVEGILVNQLEDGGDDLPELARRLNKERVNRLPPAPEPLQFDETGAIITKAEEVDDTADIMSDLKARLGEN